MSKLFTPLEIKQVRFRNRIFVAPMCQYSSQDGFPNEWHFVHLGSRAVGGAGMVMVEATAVSPIGRISPGDTGLWSSAHATAFQKITSFIKSQGAIPGMQIAHAGRKSSFDVPWGKNKLLPIDGPGWRPVAPSAIPFSEACHTPEELSEEKIDTVIEEFVNATRLSVEAGFEVLEIHMAHGFLLHEFLSPLANQRKDSYGGSFENRCKMPLLLTRAVRNAWPEKFPLFVRISATDWVEGGWDLDQSIQFSQKLREIGVDLIDCSSSGILPGIKTPAGPSYQVPFAKEIRAKAKIKTGAGGFISEVQQAEEILVKEEADVVFLAREFLRDPYWPLHAAKTLNVEADWPVQYRSVK